MNQTLKKQITKEFVQVVKDLAKIDKLDAFFGDLLEKEDFDKMVKRLAIAYWLKKNRSDENIKTNLQVTEKEILEIKNVMNTKGVKLALKYLEADEWANVWSEKIKKLATRH